MPTLPPPGFSDLWLWEKDRTRTSSPYLLASPSAACREDILWGAHLKWGQVQFIREKWESPLWYTSKPMLSISSFSNFDEEDWYYSSSKNPKCVCDWEKERERKSERMSVCVCILHDPVGLSGNFKTFYPNYLTPLPWRGEVYPHPVLLNLGRFVTTLWPTEPDTGDISWHPHTGHKKEGSFRFVCWKALTGQ